MAAADVSGWIRLQDGYRVNFAAKNPVIGLPFIRLESSSPDLNEQFQLSEGESRTTRLNGYSFVGSRAADLADYKDLTLQVEAKQ